MAMLIGSNLTPILERPLECPCISHFALTIFFFNASRLSLVPSRSKSLYFLPIPFHLLVSSALVIT